MCVATEQQSLDERPVRRTSIILFSKNLFAVFLQRIIGLTEISSNFNIMGRSFTIRGLAFVTEIEREVLSFESWIMYNSIPIVARTSILPRMMLICLISFILRKLSLSTVFSSPVRWQSGSRNVIVLSRATNVTIVPRFNFIYSDAIIDSRDYSLFGETISSICHFVRLRTRVSDWIIKRNKRREYIIRATRYFRRSIWILNG